MYNGADTCTFLENNGNLPIGRIIGRLVNFTVMRVGSFLSRTSAPIDAEVEPVANRERRQQRFVCHRDGERGRDAVDRKL